jgi:hypothetical protein
MDVTLSLDRDLEETLVLRAQERGLSLSEYIQELVRRDIGLCAPAKTDAEEKARAFVQWAKSHRITPPLTDAAISRETMYPDRW